MPEIKVDYDGNAPRFRPAPWPRRPLLLEYPLPQRSPSPIYVPRQPEATVLYQLVQGHVDAFFEYTKERYAKGLPRYVMEEL
jgi:hypothetical protein